MLSTYVPDIAWETNIRIDKQSLINFAAELDPFIAPNTNTTNHLNNFSPDKYSVLLLYGFSQPV